jgi:hypothetical protein
MKLVMIFSRINKMIVYSLEERDNEDNSRQN